VNEFYEEDAENGEQHQNEKNPWFPGPDVHKKRPIGAESKTGKGKKATYCLRFPRAKGGSAGYPET
jgi:hypothetical protein